MMVRQQPSPEQRLPLTQAQSRCLQPRGYLRSPQAQLGERSSRSARVVASLRPHS